MRGGRLDRFGAEAPAPELGRPKRPRSGTAGLLHSAAVFRGAIPCAVVFRPVFMRRAVPSAVPPRRVGPCRLRWASAVALVCALASGCVTRRMLIKSDPPGARVYVGDVEIGTTPVSHD